MDLEKLEKLTPAPWQLGGGDYGKWRVGSWKVEPCKVVCDTGNNKASRNEENAANAAFIALARNAFAIQLERGCYAVPIGGPNDREPMRWVVRTNGGHDCPPEIYRARGGDDIFPDPVSALAWVYDWWHKRGASSPNHPAESS